MNRTVSSLGLFCLVLGCGQVEERLPVPVEEVTAPVPERHGREIDEHARALAVESMEEIVEGACGPFGLMTDSDDDEMIRACSVVGSTLEVEVEQRLGLAVPGTSRETILLFAHRNDFRSFAEATGRIRAGYAGFADSFDGYVAVVVGDEDTVDVLETLAHEMTHLVLRRVFPLGVPPWLDEGLASEVGYAVDVDGFTTSEGMSAVEPIVARLKMAYTSGQVGSIERLVGLGRADFDRAVPSFDYEQSTLLVRFLLDRPQFSERFRAFLKSFTEEGAVAEEVSLTAMLEISWEELEGSFECWLFER